MHYPSLLNTPTEQSTEQHRYFRKTTKNVFQEFTETNLMTPNSKTYLQHNQFQLTSKSIVTTQIKDPCDSCPLFSTAGVNYLNDNTLEMASLKIFSSISIPSQVDLKLQEEGNIHFQQCSNSPIKKQHNRKKLSDCLKPNFRFNERSLTVQKKSYRHIRTHNPEIVPYRKHIDPLETKIVAIINKILQKKPYIKEIQNILLRLEKMNSRELLNKYIVSGVKTIKNLLESERVNIIDKIDFVINKMNNAIENELTDSSDYIYDGQNQAIDIGPLKRNLILRIYYILKSNHHDLSTNSLKDKAISIFNQYIDENSGNITKKSIITFLRVVSKKYVGN